MALSEAQQRELAREEEVVQYMRERAAKQYANLQKLRTRYGLEPTSKSDNPELAQQSPIQEHYIMEQKEKREIVVTDDMAQYGHAVLRGVYRREAGESGDDSYSDYERKFRPTTPQLRGQLREVESAIRAFGLSPAQTNRTLSTVTGPAATGESALPPWMIAIFQTALESFGTARRLFTPATMTSKIANAGLLATDTPSYWTTEGASIIPGEFGLTGSTLTAAKLASLLCISSEFNEDAGLELMLYAFSTSARSMAVKEDLAAFIGDGSDTYGGFTGIANSSTNILSASTGKTSRADIVVSDLLALKRKVAAAKRFNSAFMVGVDFWDSLCSQTDIDLRPIMSINGGERRLYGDPVELIPAMDSITDATGAPCALYGDPRHCIFGTRREIEIRPSRVGIAVSDGGDTLSNALLADLMIFQVTERIAFDLLDKNAIAVLKTAAV